MLALPVDIGEVPPRHRKALVWSMLDGTLFSVMDGLGAPALNLYAVALGMSSLAIGLVNTLPVLAGSLFQILAPAYERLCGSRKRAVVLGAAVHAAAWLLVPLVEGVPAGHLRESLLVAIVSVGTIGWFLTVPSWTSWMGDLIPPGQRARVFAWRVMPTWLVTGACVLGVGLWLRPQEANPAGLLTAFRSIFLAAAAARVLSLVCLLMQFEPEAAAPGEEAPGESVGDARGFVRVAIFFGAFHFALFIVGPYFYPYMRAAGMDYLTMTAVLAVAWPARMLFLPAWQRAAARYGPRRIILISGACTVILPWLWMLSGDWRYLLAVQVVNGALWAGIELCELPYLLDLSAPAARTRWMARYFAFRSLCGSGGAVAGDCAMKAWTAFGFRGALAPYFCVMALSGLGRAAATLWAWRRLPEGAPAKARARTPHILADVLTLR